MHLLIGSTGIKGEGEGEWNARKNGGTKRRGRREIHIGIDVKMLEILAAELTSNDLGDAAMLPELLDQIPLDQEIWRVIGDWVYDTRRCHDAIAEHRAAAVFLPRQNARPRKVGTVGSIARNKALSVS